MTDTEAAIFTGWPADATAFLTELAEENTREFWQGQRHRYDASVRPPLLALAACLADEFGQMRIFRPARDRRFRPAMPPYRLDAGGAVDTPGGCEMSVVLGPGGLSVQAGHYLFDRTQLHRYRAAVAGAPGAALAGILGRLAAAGMPLGPVPALRGRPSGYPADHERIELLRLRAVQVGTSWPAGDWLGTPLPLARVANAWRAAGPLVAWLDEYVGMVREADPG